MNDHSEEQWDNTLYKVEEMYIPHSAVLLISMYPWEILTFIYGVGDKKVHSKSKHKNKDKNKQKKKQKTKQNSHKALFMRQWINNLNDTFQWKWDYSYVYQLHKIHKHNIEHSILNKYIYWHICKRYK